MWRNSSKWGHKIKCVPWRGLLESVLVKDLEASIGHRFCQACMTSWVHWECPVAYIMEAQSSHAHPSWTRLWSTLADQFLTLDSVLPPSPPALNLALPSLFLFSLYSSALTHSAITPPSDDSRSPSQLYNSRSLGETLPSHLAIGTLLPYNRPFKQDFPWLVIFTAPTFIWLTMYFTYLSFLSPIKI